MELSSKFVGLKLAPQVTEVSWRLTTNYAAGIGDTNPRYLDDRHPGGLVASPMTAVALTWPITARLQDFIPAGEFPKEVLAAPIHYTERLIFHQLIRPGRQLVISGMIAGIRPHRTGAYCVVQYDANLIDGEPVFTEYIGAMLLGVACPDQGAGLDTPPKSDGPWDGPPTWETALPIHPLAPYIYDACSGISAPIHTSPGFAQAVGLPGIILHGTATLAQAVREIVNREAGGDPARLQEVRCRFLGLVQPGTTLQVQFLGHGPRGTAFFCVRDSCGKPAIGQGLARLAATQ